MYPTAAKLIAALCLAVAVYFASEHVKSVFPPDMAFGIFSILNAAIAFGCGWVVVGRRAGRGFAGGAFVHRAGTHAGHCGASLAV